MVFEHIHLFIQLAAQKSLAGGAFTGTALKLARQLRSTVFEGTCLLFTQSDSGHQKDNAACWFGLQQTTAEFYRNAGLSCACGQHYDVVS